MNGVRILLAEDNPGHQHLIVQSLTSAHAQVEVEVVSTGREAVRAVQDRFFDCVLLHFNLRDIRADKLLPILAKVARPLPVIVISSSRDQDTAIKSLRKGCSDFLPKMEALNGDTLWHCIEGVLQKRRVTNDDRRKLNRRIDKLTRLTNKDPLTGLSNRRCLDRLFEECRINSDRRGRDSVMMLDLDHFKLINDKYGHACGDQVLRTVADMLRSCVRRGDTVCRYGGEEFVIIKPGTSHAAAMHCAEVLREKIGRLRIRFENRRVSVTVSIGVVTCASSSLGPDMVSRSDAAMYLAKQRGRNRVETWQMVLFHEAAQRVASSSRRPVDESLQDVLTQTREHLGRTQWQHLTTHSQYVSELAVRLGEALEFDQGDLERLRVAGLCHDLGKFLIPDEVLAKPGILCEEEKALLARHAEDGAEMVLMLGADPAAADYVRSHHARSDGPAALDNCDHPITRGAKILGVADALVAMTSYRPYQPQRSFTGAVRELERESGGQFDAEVVAAVSRGALSDVCTV